MPPGAMMQQMQHMAATGHPMMSVPYPAMTPYGPPGAGSQPNMPYVQCVSVPPGKGTVVPCAAPAAPKPSEPAWTVQVGSSEGKPALDVRCEDETCMTCRRLSLTMGGSAVKLRVYHDQVKLVTPHLTASADSISRTEQADCVVLEGHVKIRCAKDGESAEVSADRAIVGLDDGHVEIKPGDDSAE